MADQSGAAPVTPPATPAPAAAAPRVLPWLVLFTLGRLAVAAALIAVLWFVGLPGIPGMLFGVLLSMPVSFVVLRPVRDRLTAALVARAEVKEALRARLRGSDTHDAPACATGCRVPPGACHRWGAAAHASAERETGRQQDPGAQRQLAGGLQRADQHRPLPPAEHDPRRRHRQRQRQQAEQ